QVLAALRRLLAHGLLGQLAQPGVRAHASGERRADDRAGGGADVSLALPRIEAARLLDAREHGVHPYLAEDATAAQHEHGRPAEAHGAPSSTAGRPSRLSAFFSRW